MIESDGNISGTSGVIEKSTRVATLRREGFVVGGAAALGAAASLLFLYLASRLLEAMGNIAPPFVGAFAVALILNPLVDLLQRKVSFLKGRRLPAVLLVYLLFLLSFIALLTFLVPTLVSQATDLAQSLPSYFDNVRAVINHFLKNHHSIGTFQLPRNFQALTTQYSDQIQTMLKTTASRIATWLLGSVSGLLNIVLVPIITFYLLNDFSRLRARLMFLLPDRVSSFVATTASDVGGVFGNYVRGMVLVSVAYGIVATVLFLMFGLKTYALLLGFVAGLLYAVPYVGPFVTALLSCIVYLATGHDAGPTAGLLVAVVVQNQAFDNFVVPRIVGDSVGLHPLITMIALFLGGELFGLWGMLLSVPVAASIQVVLFRLFPKLRAPTPMANLLPTLRITKNGTDGSDDTVVRDATKASAATDGGTGQTS